MANITELIKNIRNSIFGKDVRESIAGAIEQCYEDGAKSGNANMEVADARGIYDTLKKRLDYSDNVKADKTELEAETSTRINADSNLQNKINGVDSKLQSQINGLASGSPLVANSVSEMTNKSKVYVNTSDGHWYWYNGSSWVDGGVYQATEIADETIQTKNLDAELKNQIGSRILELSLITGKYIALDNTIQNNDNFSITEPVKLLKGEKLNYCAQGTLNSHYMIALTDENQSFIQGLKKCNVNTGEYGDYEFTASEDCYVILCYRSLDSKIKNAYTTFISKKVQTGISNIEKKIKDNTKREITYVSRNILVKNLDIEEIRRSVIGDSQIFNLPISMDSWFDILKIYKSKNNYILKDIDLSAFKNQGGRKYYISPSGDNSNHGLSKESPIRSITSFLSRCNSGDTLIFLDGQYNADCISNSTGYPISKSCNLVAENPNKVLIKSADDVTYTRNSTYSNVYQTTVNGAIRVVEIVNYEEDIYIDLIKVSSLEECADTMDSYYIDENNVFINIDEEPTNNTIAILRGSGNTPFNISGLTEKANIYIEGLKVFGSNRGCLFARNCNGYVPNIYLNECGFFFSTTTPDIAVDGVHLRGVNAIIKNCKSSYNNKDGFGYHRENGISCNIIEINCNGSCNGKNYENLSNNGSTAHVGCKVFRYGGIYFDNYGSNVADVQEGTVSINMNCLAFDSRAESKNVFDTDFSTQQPGTTMYLYNCFAKGNSYANLYAVEDSTIYYDDLMEYDTLIGNCIKV